MCATNKERKFLGTVLEMGAGLPKSAYRGWLQTTLGKTETVGAEVTQYDYGYDNRNRLVEVRENGATVQTWNYDANGNRTHEEGALVGTFDAQDRLVSYKDNEYRYTANGELTEKTNTSTNETTQYQYDAFSNLRQVTLPDGTNIEYIIDGQNRRVGKKRNGQLEQGFLYEGQLNPVAELDGNNNITTRFVYGDKGHVPSYIIKDGTNYRVLSDHLGSVRLVVNASTGEVAQRMDYDAWGNVTNDTNPGFQPFGYAGGIYDRDTELVRFGARDYDPEIGRWTTKDPIGFRGGLNHYAYVVNDPIGRVDLDGKDSQDIDTILNHISNSHNLNKPGFRFEDDIDNGDRTAQYDFGSNEIVLDSALECKGLSQEEYLDLYKTLYHETLHHNQSFFEVAVDQWVELFGGVGPYHQDIFEQTSDLYLDPQSTVYDDVIDLYEDTH